MNEMDDFKLKNYTTSIDSNKTISEIEKILVSFGADKIMKQYAEDGTPNSLMFSIQKLSYQLPANIEKAKERLKKLKIPQSRLDEQAPKVAWRVIKDWLHSQLSLIYIGQAEIDQGLLPYMSNGVETVYEIYKSGNLQIENKGE